jgi:hypothetical protein
VPFLKRLNVAQDSKIGIHIHTANQQYTLPVILERPDLMFCTAFANVLAPSNQQQCRLPSVSFLVVCHSVYLIQLQICIGDVAVLFVASTGAYLAGRPLLQLKGSKFEILPEDRFVLAVSGVVPGWLTYVPMTGSMMAAAYRTAHSHAYPAGGHAAKQFMNTLKLDIHAHNVETLLNLALIGVADAVCKLKRFQFQCALYLSVGQLSLGTTIAINVDKAVLPQASDRLVLFC